MDVSAPLRQPTPSPAGGQVPVMQQPSQPVATELPKPLAATAVENMPDVRLDLSPTIERRAASRARPSSAANSL